ncbi:MAG: hypothetical protein VW454_07010, partial [Pelagibacteraceae bacterium]
LKLLKSILFMHSSINLFDKVIEGHASTTVMALEVGIILHHIKIPPRLVLVPLGITTDRTTEGVKVILNPFKFL